MCAFVFDNIQRDQFNILPNANANADANAAYKNAEIENMKNKQKALYISYRFHFSFIGNCDALAVSFHHRPPDRIGNGRNCIPVK